MSNIEKVMDRIKKLLALSTSSNPNEAAIAAAKAAQLMAEYELEEADLRVESGEANQDPIDATDWDGISGKRTSQWRGYLVTGLLKAFHCHGWYETTFVYRPGARRRSGVVKFRIVGRRTNVRTANYMYLYLENELLEMSEKAWNGLSASTASLCHGKHWKNSFLLGAAMEINRRLTEQVKAQEAILKDTTSKALILVRQDHTEVDKYYHSVKPKTHTMGYNSRADAEAYEQGREEGSKVNLGGSKPSLGPAPKQIAA